jgi:trigger factor
VKVTTEARDNRQLGLTIEVEPERVEAALAKANKRLQQKYKIPGFRPGHAPRAVVEQMLGKTALYDEAVDELGQEVYKEALDEQNIDPYGPGQLEDVQHDPFVLKMIVPLAPEVKLGDYKSVRVPYEEPQIDEHDVEHQLEHIQENQAIIEPAGEDAVADDHMVATADIESTVDDKPFINQKAANISLAKPLDPVDAAEDIDLPGHIIGLHAGEDKEFSIVVPDTDNYGDFRGKTANFKIHLIELKKRELPALDDALAQTVGDYETLDALKTQLRSELMTSLKKQSDSKYSDKVIDAFVQIATIDFPPQMVDSEIHALIERTEKRLKDQNMSMKEYLKALSKTEEEYHEELRPTAEIRLKRGLLLNELIKVENVTVTDETIDKRIAELVEPYGSRADEARKIFSTDESRDALRLDLLSQAGVDRAVAIAKGEALA